MGVEGSSTCREVKGLVLRIVSLDEARVEMVGFTRVTKVGLAMVNVNSTQVMVASRMFYLIF
jgi:hypothetical protein